MLNEQQEWQKQTYNIYDQSHIIWKNIHVYLRGAIEPIIESISYISNIHLQYLKLQNGNQVILRKRRSTVSYFVAEYLFSLRWIRSGVNVFFWSENRF